MRNTEMKSAEVVKKSLQIASEIDIYTNKEIVVEEFPCAK